MKRTLFALFACWVLIGAPAPLAGQDKPSFVGTWKLFDPAAPEMFTPTVMTVVQDATALTVTTTSQMGQFKTSYRLDGSEAPSPTQSLSTARACAPATIVAPSARSDELPVSVPANSSDPPKSDKRSSCETENVTCR